jgi:hypothetical protein
MSLKESITVQDVCSLLNELLIEDAKCIHDLVNARIICNSKIADHPTVQVQQYKGEQQAKVGLLGIINGLFGIRDDGMGAICVDIDDDDKIIRFKETPES